MKCEKCGFVSFDYLSECRRCGADLAAARERLGFSALKSEVPFLLGTLLKGGGTQDASSARPGAEPARVGSESMDGLRVEPSSQTAASPESFPPPPQGEVETAPPESEELIIELSEEDLESLSGDQEKNRARSPGKTP